MKARLTALVVGILLIGGLWLYHGCLQAYAAPGHTVASHTVSVSAAQPDNSETSSQVIPPHLNRKVIGRLLIIEIIMLCMLFIGIACWSDKKLEILIILWSFSQAIINAILIGCNQADVIISGQPWPIGYIYGLMFMGVIVTFLVLMSRRKRVMSDDLQTELYRHDKLTGLLESVVFFPIVPLVFVPDMAVAAIIILIAVTLYAYLYERNRRAQLRRQVDPYGTSVYNLRLSTLQKNIATCYPGYSVVIRDNAEGDHRIVGMHYLTKRISVSVAALRQLTSEELTMMAAMQIESRFASYVKVVGWVLVLASFLYMMGLPWYSILLYMLSGIIDSCVTDIISVAADKRAIYRLGSVPTAISLLQKQILEANQPSQDFRPSLEHRLRAIMKRERLSVQC